MQFLQFMAATRRALMGVPPSAHAEKRVAPVVGNGAYLHTNEIADPVCDAR
jgi:hypothetical protein